MANSRSSKKRIKINKRNNIKNNSYNSLIKTFTKKYINLIRHYKKDQNIDNYLLVKNSLSLVFSQIDRATKKNILQKNTASRKKSKLYKMLKIYYKLKIL
uniref:Ribosomal protein S20 n=1 Tax=Protohalopteris sp. TaxID=2843287 RepID=A0A8F0JY03_9PHAE|nr:ribosomal protein S20 [Protohalopteris sp.]